MRKVILSSILLSLLSLAFLNTNAQSLTIEKDQDYKNKIDLGFSDGLPYSWFNHFILWLFQLIRLTGGSCMKTLNMIDMGSI